MTEIQQVIEDALRRYRGIRWKRAWLATFAAFALVMAVAALLDRTWMFSGWARWSGWVAGFAVAAWAARRAAGPACPDASALAHQVEAEAGESAPVVATAIDPAVRRTAEREVLAGVLLDRLDRRAAETIRVAPPTFRGRLRTPAVLAVAAAAALVALVAVQGGSGLWRMLVPWQASPYTALALEGPAGALAEGQAFTLTARVSGVPVDKVTLFRRDLPEPLAEAAPDEGGLVRLTVAGLDGPADFVARGGDGQSEPLRVEPYALPQIEAFEISVTPPAYATHAADTETEPSFSVIRGSRLRYRLHLKTPAVAVAVERSAVSRKEERVPAKERATLRSNGYGQLLGVEAPGAEHPAGPVFRPDPADPLVWETDWDLPGPEDIVYRLVIEGGHGDLVRNDEPWRINVLADAPPTVRILGHNGGEVIKVGNETVRFDLSAVDDVRLVAARLVFRKPGRPHLRSEIKLPPEARRTWTGAELLALAPLDLGPLDIVAVHAEAEDANDLDGPGVGRSEVVFLEVPLPESADDGGGGGGGGGGGAEPINPLELQMEILRSTVALPDNAPAGEQQALAHDQRQNAEYAGMMEQAAAGAGVAELATALHKARVSMESAARLLDDQPPGKAVPDEEAALGALIDAAKLLEDPETGLALGGAADGAMKFTLRPPRPRASAPKEGEENGEKNRKSLRDLMAEVQRQLAEQKELNQGSGKDGERADQQQSLAQDARSAAGRARGMPASSGRGDPRAAAEELERAAGLQDDNAEALADGDAESSAQLGERSAEALAEALRELGARLKTETDEGAARPPGYERLISDYLRSISYE